MDGFNTYQKQKKRELVNWKISQIKAKKDEVMENTEENWLIVIDMQLDSKGKEQKNILIDNG